ncbi:MAG: hypothetical protein PHW60_00240 [Kiritimatiellae bacterium]|nr:hypothetical protein [Kiritimatiellia bacterium]
MSEFVLNVVKAQVDATLCEIDRLEGSEFPYEHSKKALDEIRQLFKDHQESLLQLTSTTDKGTVALVCNSAFSSVKSSLDILGFILRSTNVRNAFEVYGPFLRMAQKLLGKDTKLLISSEWYFSPFTFIGYQQLPGFVLIGLPATESANPLLLPLAGHELGHSVWVETSRAVPYRKPIEDCILEGIKTRWSEYKMLFPQYEQSELNTNFFAQQTWKPAWSWAMKQAEELFCDFLGLRVFGESYLHALAYMLAPLTMGKRPENYPNTVERAQTLVTAAKNYGVNVPENYVRLYTDRIGPIDEQRQVKFLLSLADQARVSVHDKLIQDADTVVGSSGIPSWSQEEITQCLEAFALAVPAQRINSLSSILNAAWQAYFAPTLFSEMDKHRNRNGILGDVVLKSIEVFEIEKRLAGEPSC